VFRHEWTYFLDGAELLGLPAGAGARLAPEGRKLAALAGCERELVFIHRDYQSRNLMAAPGGIRVIDWQGGRLGPPFYDLASLIYDPYADLSPEAGGGILAAYLEARESRRDPREYTDRIRFFGLMRLMQASGAYSHLAALRGRPSYAGYLDRSLRRALALARDLPPGVFPGTVGFIEDYLARLPGMLEALARKYQGAGGSGGAGRGDAGADGDTGAGGGAGGDGPSGADGGGASGGPGPAPAAGGGA
jgi:hypothetical protein